MNNERKYSTEIATKIHDFLRKDDWNFRFDEERGVFKFGLHLRSKMKELNYLIRVKRDSFIVYGIFAIGADANDSNMMERMAEFICRCNYGLVNGNFELDFRDGEIRFKSFVDCDGVLPSENVIQNAIHCTAIMAERYSDGMLDIIFTSCSAKSAVERCERDSTAQLRRMLDSIEEGVNGAQVSSSDVRHGESDVINDDLFGEGGDA